MLKVDMLNVTKLKVIMLNVILLSVVAPIEPEMLFLLQKKKLECW